MAIFYIPHDRTLTYLMRNSKQHRVSSSAVVCAGCGLAECSEYLAWQARHVLRAPNDVFICNHILLRTHYGALTALCAGNHLDCVFWFLAAVAGTRQSCQSWHRHSRWGKSWDSPDITNRRLAPAAATQIYAARGKFGRRDKTAKKSEIPCLTLSEWPS